MNGSLGLVLTVTVPRFLVRPEGELPGLIRRQFGLPPKQTPGVSATPEQCEDGSRCTAAATGGRQPPRPLRKGRSERATDRRPGTEPVDQRGARVEPAPRVKLQLLDARRAIQSNWNQCTVRELVDGDEPFDISDAGGGLGSTPTYRRPGSIAFTAMSVWPRFTPTSRK